MKMTAFYNSPVGMLKISGDQDGISAVAFTEEEYDLSEDIPDELKACVEQLDEYFTKKRKTFDLLLNPEGTEFQKSVWNELIRIPFASTRIYMEQAKLLGNVKAIRAVAAANGKNPIAIIIPCHRVVGSDGSLTGYAGGIWRKKWLLDFENPPNQLELFGE